MRFAALLVLLSLGGPPIAGFLCDSACAPHGQPAPVAATECHELAPATNPALAPEPGRCHDHGAPILNSAIVPAPSTAALSGPSPAPLPQADVAVLTITAPAAPVRSSASSTLAAPLRI